jgi:hypothetical protein
MGFRECTVVERREEFCRLALAAGANVSALCTRFEISRRVGYKWLKRYEEAGVEGLRDRSRRPKSSPSRTPEAIEALVVQVRAEQPVWGGRKIRRILLNDGLAAAPAASTITAILGRHGLLAGQAEDRNTLSPTSYGRWTSRATSPPTRGAAIP